MSNVFTLDSLREEVDKEFKPLVIPLSDGSEAVLRGVLRLNEKARDEILKLLDSIGKKSGEDIDDIEEDQLKVLSTSVTRILELASTKSRQLLKDLDGDVQLGMKVLETWMEATQPGEAENSPA